MDGDQDFRDRRHADRVGAAVAQKSCFRRGFQAGAGDADIGSGGNLFQAEIPGRGPGSI